MAAWNPIPESGEERSPRLDPEVLSERCSTRGVELELRVPSDLDCWPGHFPIRPIVPGVVQIDWVMRLAVRRIGGARLSRIQGLKFKRLMGPGQRFTLVLETDPGTGSFHFRLVHGDTLFSTGALRVDAEPEGRT